MKARRQVEFASSSPASVTFTLHARVRYVERCLDRQFVTQLRNDGLAERDIHSQFEKVHIEKLRDFQADVVEKLSRLAIQPGYDKMPAEFVIPVRGVRVIVRKNTAITILPPRHRRQSSGERGSLNATERAALHAERDSRFEEGA